jgi:hypothetical protein
MRMPRPWLETIGYIGVVIVAVVVAVVLTMTLPSIGSLAPGSMLRPGS